METFLILAAFCSSTLTAVLGVGGGMLLITVMALFLPPAALVPVHGVVQLASNASRSLFALRDVRRDILLPFCGGCLLGALFGIQVVPEVPSRWMTVPLGLFALTMTWLPNVKHRLRLPGRFFGLGVAQAFLTLFIGATGPLNLPFLLRENLPRDQTVVTAAALMTVVHAIKIVAFGVLGFAFGTYLWLMVLMAVAVVAGSWAGTRLRGKVSEELFRRVFKALITVLALRMVVGAFVG